MSACVGRIAVLASVHVVLFLLWWSTQPLLPAPQQKRGMEPPKDDLHQPSPTADQLASAVAAPVALTNLSTLVTKLSSTRWEVAAGEQVPAFLFANGAGSITQAACSSPR